MPSISSPNWRTIAYIVLASRQARSWDFVLPEELRGRYHSQYHSWFWNTHSRPLRELMSEVRLSVLTKEDGTNNISSQIWINEKSHRACSCGLNWEIRISETSQQTLRNPSKTSEEHIEKNSHLNNHPSSLWLLPWDIAEMLNHPTSSGANESHRRLTQEIRERSLVWSPYREFWDHMSLEYSFDLVTVWFLLFQDLANDCDEEIGQKSEDFDSYICHSSKSNKTSFLCAVILEMIWWSVIIIHHS